MKIILLSLLIPTISQAITLEGRYLEKNDKCRILVNENQLSGKREIPVKCELFLVDQYKYKFEINPKSCPYKINKIQIIPPGTKAKVLRNNNEIKDC